jgi:flavin-binding protein dodecin
MVLLLNLKIKIWSTAIVAGVIAHGSAIACGGPLDVACNIGAAAKKGAEDAANTGKKAIDDVGHTGKKAIDDTIKAGEKAGQDTANTGKKAVSDTVNSGKKAIDDILSNAQKAVDDVVWNAVKGANDIVDAGKATGRFIEHQVQGMDESLSDAEKRFREGKIVDAAWHLWTDPYKNQEEGIAKAAQESALINTTLQAAASYYGGPAGAAAYAAWYTYRATNDLEMALRVGVITGVTSAGYANAAAMPTGSIGEVTKKALVTGAMGGVAVAAAGGDDAAVRDAFLKSGGMVVVQSGQSYVTKKYVDPAVAKADAYCMSAVGYKCSIVLPKLQRDAQGNVVVDENGRPKFDNSVKLPERAQIGSWQQKVEVAGQNAIKKGPGANQKFTKDNQWAISWDQNAFTNRSASTPAVVFTYTGRGSPFDEKVQEIKAWAVSPAPPPAPVLRPGGRDVERVLAVTPTWVALSDPGASSLFFDRVFPAIKDGPVIVGELLKSRRDINMRPTPADWAAKPIILKQGTLVSVTGKTTLTDEKGRTQEWARVESADSRLPLSIVLGSDSRAEADNDPSSGEVTGLQLPIWCFERAQQHAFEVRADNTVRGLTSLFSGFARRQKDGSIRIKAMRNADIGTIQLPFQESIEGRIGVKGDLFVRDYGGTTSAGYCRSVI